MTAGKAIYQILDLDSDVDALVEGRVYPELAAQDAETPYVTYHIRSVSPEDTKNGTSTLDVVTFEVYAVGPDYGVLQDVAEACRNAIDRQAGNFNSTAIQSSRYMDEDCDFDPESADYIASQTFEVRHQRTGVVQDMGNITIQEKDGSPSASVGTLIFPNDSISVSGETGTITFPGSAFKYARRSVSSLYLNGGEQAQDFNSTTPQLVKFDTTDNSTTGHGFTFGTGSVDLPADGYYRLTARVVFVIDSGSGSAPHIVFNVQGVGNFGGDGVAFLPGSKGVIEASALITAVYEGTSGQTIGVQAFDQSNQNESVKMESATFEIERLT